MRRSSDLSKAFPLPLLVLAVIVVGCGGWEKLPSYHVFQQGMLHPGDTLRTDGFYVTGLSGHSPFYVNDEPARRYASVLCFYSDGACFGTSLDCYDHIDSVIPHLQRFLATDWGRRQSRESGLFWGLYTVKNDTIQVEDFFPINGGYQAQATRLALLSDTSLVTVSWVNIHRQGIGIRGDPIYAEALTPWRFLESNWKPDSMEFLRTNVAFIQSQGAPP